MSFTKDSLAEAVRLFANSNEANQGRNLFRQFVIEAGRNPAEFDYLFENLADEESREVLSWALRFRTVAFLSQSRDMARKIVPSRISEVEWQRMVDTAQTLPEAKYEKNLDVDLVENFILDGYNLPGICEVEAKDVVLDCGAFNGNSAIALGRHCPDGRVYAFEPNPAMLDVLKRNVAKSGLKNIEVIPAGLAQEKTKLRFKRDGAASRPDPKGDVEVDVISIDSWVAERKLQSVDFIKFDIEGFEQPALRGCIHTIRHFRPKLAISIYHLFNDFTMIPRMVQDMGGWYRFYLRHNAVTGGEIVLFCQPR